MNKVNALRLALPRVSPRTWRSYLEPDPAASRIAGASPLPALGP